MEVRKGNTFTSHTLNCTPGPLSVMCYLNRQLANALDFVLAGWRRRPDLQGGLGSFQHLELRDTCACSYACVYVLSIFEFWDICRVQVRIKVLFIFDFTYLFLLFGLCAICKNASIRIIDFPVILIRLNMNEMSTISHSELFDRVFVPTFRAVHWGSGPHGFLRSQQRKRVCQVKQNAFWVDLCM